MPGWREIDPPLRAKALLERLIRQGTWRAIESASCGPCNAAGSVTGWDGISTRSRRWQQLKTQRWKGGKSWKQRCHPGVEGKQIEWAPIYRGKTSVNMIDTEQA